MAYLNHDKTILVWGDFVKYQQLFRRIATGDQQLVIPYQPENGLCQIMMSVLYHTRDEVSTFWILSSLVENYELRQFY